MKALVFFFCALWVSHTAFGDSRVGAPQVQELRCTAPDGRPLLGAVTTLEVTTQPVNPSGNIRKVEIVRQIVSFPMVTRRQLLREIHQDLKVAEFEFIQKSPHEIQKWRVELDKTSLKAQIFVDDKLSWICE